MHNVQYSLHFSATSLRHEGDNFGLMHAPHMKTMKCTLSWINQHACMCIRAATNPKRRRTCSDIDVEPARDPPTRYKVLTDVTGGVVGARQISSQLVHREDITDAADPRRLTGKAVGPGQQASAVNVARGLPHGHDPGMGPRWRCHIRKVRGCGSTCKTVAYLHDGCKTMQAAPTDCTDVILTGVHMYACMQL